MKVISIVELRRSLEALQSRLQFLPRDSSVFEACRVELMTLAAKVVEALEIEFVCLAAFDGAVVGSAA